MKRNLRFWTRFTWENVEAELSVVGVFLLLNLFNSDALWGDGLRSLAEFIALLPFYLIFAAAFCFMMIAPGCQALYLPLLISHGEPRKNVYWGYQFHRFLIIAVTAAVSGLVWALVPSGLSAACLSCLPVIVTGLVIASAVGNLMGSAFIKWKWLGIVIMVVFFGTCGGLVGWLGSTGRFDVSSISISVFALGLKALSLPWQMVIIAAALLAVDLGVQWLLIRRREVKF